MNILVVDGEKGAREVLSDTICRTKYQPTFASSGEEALDLFRKIRFDLVIANINLPGIDGLELLIEIIKIDLTVAVTVTTASDIIATYLKATSLGDIEYIDKPFQMRDINWIDHLLLEKWTAKSRN